MAGGGACPNCGHYLTMSVTKGKGTRKCPKCGKTIVFVDGKPVGTN